METGQALKKAARIAAHVLLYVFIALCLLGVVLTVTAKTDADGTATILGKQLRIVLSPSMERSEGINYSELEIKDIPVRSMVFIDVVPESREDAVKWYAELEVGDVLTFKYAYVRQETITHRITGIRDEGEGRRIIELAGDNRNAATGVLTQTIDTAQTNSPNYIIGKVTGQCYLLGLFVSLLQSPIGLVCLVILPSLAIVIHEIIKLVGMHNAEKRKRETEEQNTELEALRRRVAELEAREADTAPEEPPSEGSDPTDGTNGEEP